MGDLKSDEMNLDEIHNYELGVSYKKLCEILDEQSVSCCRNCPSIEDENETLQEINQQLQIDKDELEDKLNGIEKCLQSFQKLMEEINK